MHTITESTICTFQQALILEEKSPGTILKYVNIIRELSAWLAGTALTKEKLLEYRSCLLQNNKPQTVNGKLSAVNLYLKSVGQRELQVKFLKVQHQAFLDERRELTEAEYKRLLHAAKERGNERLYLLMMTICGTGIRVSELPFITLEAARRGRAEIHLKGKCRIILLPRLLCQQLLQYAKKHGISNGHIFRTRSGKPLDRSNICHDMKKLCRAAKVDERKVFPHSLRHLFARSFYAVEKNLAHLADVLGHSRIETTRIYVAVSAKAHSRILERMKLIL